MYKIRFWLIRLLAGKATIVLNARLGGQAMVNLRTGDHFLVMDNIIEVPAAKLSAFAFRQV